MIIRIDYPQAQARLDLWGGTSGQFNGIDRFNRVIDQRWQNNTSGIPADIDRYQYGYDQNSNRQYKANVVGTPVVSGGLDEYYAYDRVNRLNQMQRGTLNGTKTGISGTPSREMDWTLDPTGNWPGYLTKTTGTTDLNQSRASNKVNEITAVSESTGPTWVTPAYDAAGNTTTMPQVSDPTQGFTAVYDAWNRMTQISVSGTPAAKYQYDGRSRRIVKQTYTGGTLIETRHFYFTNAWQDVEEHVGTSTSMDKQYVWGLRYVDELVCRDDATPQRLYACQDANFNATSITDTSGIVLERFVYDPYGTDEVMAGTWASMADEYLWTMRFTGREYELETQVYHYRARSYHPVLGIFSQRDPLSYVDGFNLYQAFLDNPIDGTDSSGTSCSPWVPSSSAAPQLKTKLFDLSEWVPNPPFTNSVMKHLFPNGLGSHLEQRKVDYEVLIEQDYEFSLGVAGKPIAPGVARGTVVTIHNTSYRWGQLKNEAASRNRGNLVGVECSKFFMWVEACTCCSDPDKNQWQTGARAIDIGWETGTLVANGAALFGVSCNAQPVTTIPPSGSAVCANGHEVVAGEDYV